MPEKEIFHEQIQIHPFHHPGHPVDLMNHTGGAGTAVSSIADGRGASNSSNGIGSSGLAGGTTSGLCTIGGLGATIGSSSIGTGVNSIGFGGPYSSLQLPSAFVAFHSQLSSGLDQRNGAHDSSSGGGARYLWDPTGTSSHPTHPPPPPRSSFHHPSSHV